MKNKTALRIGKVSLEQMLTMDRAISREMEIQSGSRINHHRVIASKKTYNRNVKHKSSWS